MTQLKEDLTDNFTTSNGFTKVYEIRVGVYDPDQLSALPSIGLWMDDDTVEEDLMDNTIFRKLNLFIYGHVDADMIDDYQTFYKLISDVETFLYSTYSTFYRNTVLGDVLVRYNGATDETGMFKVNFSVLYSQAGLGS